MGEVMEKETKQTAVRNTLKVSDEQWEAFNIVTKRIQHLSVLALGKHKVDRSSIEEEHIQYAATNALSGLILSEITERDFMFVIIEMIVGKLKEIATT